MNYCIKTQGLLTQVCQSVNSSKCGIINVCLSCLQPRVAFLSSKSRYEPWILFPLRKHSVFQTLLNFYHCGIQLWCFCSYQRLTLPLEERGNILLMPEVSDTENGQPMFMFSVTPDLCVRTLSGSVWWCCGWCCPPCRWLPLQTVWEPLCAAGW